MMSPSSASKISPVKSPMAVSSPRLRSPRGFNHKHGGVLLGLLRNVKVLLVCLGVAILWFIRPSPMDPGSNLVTFSGSAFDVGSLLNQIQEEDASSSDTSPEFLPPDVSLPAATTPEIQYLRTVAPVELPKDDKESTDEDQKDDSIEETDKAQMEEESSQESLQQPPSWISTYHPARKPLIALDEHETPSVDVHLIVDVSAGTGVGPQSKFLLDGLERSPLTNVVGMTFLNPNMHQVSIGKRKAGNPTVWLVDWGSLLRDCHRLQRVLAKLERQSEDYVLLADFSGSTRQSRCEHLFPDDDRIRLAKRSIVEGRYYNRDNQTIHEGEVAPNSGAESSAGPVMQTSFVVRERFVSALHNNTRENNPMKSTRRTDVCFFWKEGDYSHYSFWRREVSNFVLQLANSSNYTSLVDMVANDEDGMEAGNIQIKYVKSLIHCKIVVIAQRDEWADHYRLYESLASGALVLTDPIIAPPEGLKNKTNIMVYDSLESLGRMIHHFLENKDRRKSVGRRGMELALGRFRSWHRVEEMLFGSPISHVDEPYASPPPKMSRPQITLVDGDAVVAT